MLVYTVNWTCKFIIIEKTLSIESQKSDYYIIMSTEKSETAKSYNEALDEVIDAEAERSSVEISARFQAAKAEARCPEGVYGRPRQ